MTINTRIVDQQHLSLRELEVEGRVGVGGVARGGGGGGAEGGVDLQLLRLVLPQSTHALKVGH